MNSNLGVLCTDAASQNLSPGRGLVSIHEVFHQRPSMVATLLLPLLPTTLRNGVGQADVARVQSVKSAQRLGFSLDEIAELLRREDCSHYEEAMGLAEHKLKDVSERLADLTRMEAALAGLVCACHARKGKISCPLIASLQGEEEPFVAG